MKNHIVKAVFILLFGFVALANNANAKSIWLVNSKKKATSSFIYDADFSQEWTRNPSPDALVAHFQTVFPDALMNTVGNDCLAITDANKTLLGVDDTVTGSALLKKPSAAFVTWYTDCTKQVVLANYYSLFSQDQILFGKGLKSLTAGGVGQACERILGQKIDQGPNAINQLMAFCTWTSFTPAEKTKVVNYWITELIGPNDVVVDLGLAKSIDELAGTIVDTVNEFNAAPTDDWSFLGISKTPLSAISATRMIQFLVLITDAFQY